MKQPPLQFAMHIGAHKTATTHLQHSIASSRVALAEVGVHFYGPQQLRGARMGLVERLGVQWPNRPPVADVDVVQALQEMAPGGRRLVVSEENYVGSLQGRKGRMRRPLYKLAPDRIEALARCIGLQSLTVHLAIRSPTRFLSSSYGQALIGGQSLPIEAYKQLNPLMNVDWADLVARLRATPGVSALTVWRYEDYAQVFGDICADLLGEQAAALVRPVAHPVNSGLSNDAVKVILADPKAVVHDVRAAHPVTADAPAFDGFTADEHALGEEFYADQMTRITAMTDVMFLRP